MKPDFVCIFVASLCLPVVLQAEERSRLADWASPLIKSEGEIVKLPQAEMQPQAGSKVVFDVSIQPEPDKVAKGLTRAARWLNLNAATNVPPSQLRVALVLHGDATKAVLTDSAYAKQSGVDRNPNLKLLSELKSHGVELYVCGQALAHHGYPAADVAEEVKIATAALTVLIHKQQQGYAFLPY